MKICTKCKINKEDNCFNLDHRFDPSKLRSQCKSCSNSYVDHVAYKKEYYKKNRESVLVKSKKYHQENPQKAKNSGLKRQYGIDLDQYNVFLKNQNDVCAICHKSSTAIDKRTGKTKMLAVDHDHNTGKIRGLLCEAHNRALGMFHDNIEELQSAIAYLGRKISS